ncbi:hypothetical protein ACCQ08_09800 [Comamonas sp. SY3]|uniref:hypothetical protein n=1 Tax=Comamonas sp. SY3 TaxID=3243601 RepID=UPI0035944716
MDILKQIYKTSVVVLGLILTLVSIPSAWVAISAHFKTYPNDPLFTIFPAFLNWLGGYWNIPRWIVITLALLVIARSANLMLGWHRNFRIKNTTPIPHALTLSQLSRNEKIILYGFLVAMEAQGSSTNIEPKEFANTINESVAQIEAAFLHLYDKDLVMIIPIIVNSGRRYSLTSEGKKFIAANEVEISAEVNSFDMNPSKDY